MQTLDQLAIQHVADKSSAYHGYTACYAELFEVWRDEPIRLVEIGVQFGASMKLWLDYFSRAHIFGIDICQAFTTDNPRCTILQADQGNAQQMTDFAQAHRPFDIVIDDGCHLGAQIQTSFNCLWPAVKGRGLYIIEDCFTHWHPAFSSPVNGQEFIKSFVDDVNLRGKSFYGMPNPPHRPPTFTDLERTIDSVTYSKGLTIIRKRA